MQRRGATASARARLWSGLIVGLVAGLVLWAAGALAAPRVSPHAMETVDDALFTRVTGEGMVIRAYVRAGESSAASGCRPGTTCPPCAEHALVSATFNGQRYGGGAAIFKAASVPTLAIPEASGGGGPGLPTIAYVVARVSDGVELVRTRFDDGFTDEMKPVRGWAVLAAYGSLGRFRTQALDSSGNELAAATRIVQAPDCTTGR